MSTTTGHLIGRVDGVSLALAGDGAEGADMKSMPMSPNGLSAELLEELAALAAKKIRGKDGKVGVASQGACRNYDHR